MENKVSKATIKNLPVSPQKLRLVADVVRGKDVPAAKANLMFINKKGAKLILKALNSAVANSKAKEEDLKISHISVDGEKISKKGRASARGRYVIIRKRKSTLNLELETK